MIKLTRIGDVNNFYISPENVTSVYVESGVTKIYAGDVIYSVEESQGKVARLITEYKQRQMRLQASYGQLARGLDGEYLALEIDALESEDRGE